MSTAREVKMARAVIAKHERQEEVKRDAERQAFVGRFFKTKNRYSDGEDWWLYATVTRAADGRVTGWSFQDTSMGQIEIARDTYLGMIPAGTWTEISSIEFYQAAHALLGVIVRQLTLASDAKRVDHGG